MYAVTREQLRQLQAGQSVVLDSHITLVSPINQILGVDWGAPGTTDYSVVMDQFNLPADQQPPALRAMLDAEREMEASGGSVCAFTPTACPTCDGTGTVNAYPGPDNGSNSFENWPNPCPTCNGG